MKQTLFRLYATTMLFLGGCSSSLTLPWDSNLLDPSRVATREPLEIPPDLDTLPPTGNAQEPEGTHKATWADPALTQKHSTKVDNKQTIHLPPSGVESQDDSAAAREKQEKLPDWMGNTNKGSDVKIKP